MATDLIIIFIQKEMSNQYYKCEYYTVIDPYGNTETRYVYGHYQGCTDTWGFKDLLMLTHHYL